MLGSLPEVLWVNRPEAVADCTKPRQLAVAAEAGLSRMAAASQGVTRDQLLWTHDAYIRDESYRAALADLRGWSALTADMTRAHLRA